MSNPPYSDDAIQHLEEGHKGLSKAMSDLSQEVSKGFAEVRGLISTVVAKLDAQAERQSRHEAHVEKLEDEIQKQRERQYQDMKDIRKMHDARIEAVERTFEVKLRDTTQKVDKIQTKVWVAVGGVSAFSFIAPILIKTFFTG
jgi:dsDNA-specific endonuclease/ATPase MutS2